MRIPRLDIGSMIALRFPDAIERRLRLVGAIGDL